MAVGAELRRRRRWRWAFLALGLAAALAFAVNLALGEVDPAGPWGLAYGIAAALLVVAVGLYGLRRRSARFVSRYRLGSARSWLTFHLWGGGLFLLLVLMHSGFALPTGGVTWALWLLSLWTVASGLVGLGLQRWIPRVLGSGLGLEVLYERIPEMVGELRAQAEGLVATCDPSVRRVYDRGLAPALTAPHRRLQYFVDITGGHQGRLKELDYLRQFLAPEEDEKVERLARLYRAKLELDAHYTLQGALRWWLAAHLPASVLLVAFLAIHLFTVLYY